MSDSQNFFNFKLLRIEQEKSIATDSYRVRLEIDVPSLEDFEHRIVQRLMDSAKEKGEITLGLSKPKPVEDDYTPTVSVSAGPVSCTW